MPKVKKLARPTPPPAKPAAASPEPLVAVVATTPGGSWRRLPGGLWGYLHDDPERGG
jgi:hypothetical protein